eukprot:gene31867-39367_t
MRNTCSAMEENYDEDKGDVENTIINDKSGTRSENERHWAHWTEAEGQTAVTSIGDYVTQRGLKLRKPS